MVYPFEIITATMNKLSTARFVNYDFGKVASLADSKDARSLIQTLPEVKSLLERELASLKYG